MSLRIATCAWLLLLGVSERARAVEPDAMARGLAAYEELDYQRAVEQLALALAHADRLEDRIAIVRALAFSHVALEQLDQARAAFQLLLQLDPAARLDRTISPRARAVFDEVQANLRDPSAVLATIAPARPRAGQAIVLSVITSGGVSAQLYYRTRGAAPYSRLAADGRDGKLVLTVPGLAVQAPGFEYYVIALDDHAAPMGSAGTPDRPLAVAVEAAPPARRALYRRPWFWGTVALAASAVAATVAAVVVVSRAGSSAHVVIAHP